ncbi:MAG: hypothetical protein KJ950_04210 [Proteobacteria bacterium]|nr:hypothetical protein [Pseudomonadota bacterium]MBU1688469.1 hypothetical protein [Pseudomonadota bacterium]
MKIFSLIYGLVLLALMAGCSGRFVSEEFLREDVDLEAISRIAVLPFQNNSNDLYASERSRNIAITQLLAMGVADVVDRGVVDSVMIEEVIDPTLPVDMINLKRLGQRLNVQAFLLGSVDLVDSTAAGSSKYPQVALTLRLVDAQASMIIWQASGRWTTETILGRIFGIAPTDNFHVNLKLIRNMLRNLAQK